MGFRKIFMVVNYTFEKSLDIRMKNKIFLASILSLILGTAIYLLFRASSLKIFNWLEILTIDFRSSDIRNFSISYIEKLPNWFLFSLPDGLWIFSYVCLMVCIWNFKFNYQSIFWICIIPIIAISSELGQAINLVKGTFDILDLVFYILGFCIPFILIFNNKNYKLLNHE